MRKPLRQMDLFSESTNVKIALEPNHELVRLTKAIDWDEMIEKAMDIREAKIKGPSGPAPHYRELLGAVALMAVKQVTYRDAEDLIAHYAPARYLCKLMDSTWSPDHITIFEFTQMLGADGVSALNSEILSLAVKEGYADPTRLMSDTTAQEARIPYPNEVGLMARYTQIVKKSVKGTGKFFSKIKEKIRKVEKKIKGLVRSSHLFAKTKEQKQKIGKKLHHVTKEVHQELMTAFATAGALKEQKVLGLQKVSTVMETLLPQILHFIKTGFVAPKKIIHLKMPELYSIVRGKAGKSVEFGLKWGVNRIGGGFVQGFLIGEGKHCSDKKFCLESLAVHKNTLGVIPEVFGFDRGGYSRGNIKKAKSKGVKHVGIAPKGKDQWPCSKKMKEIIKCERAQVEGCIGTIKCSRYGFNKPNAKSVKAMATYGHRAIFGFNMRKLLREQANLLAAAT